MSDQSIIFSNNQAVPPLNILSKDDLACQLILPLISINQSINQSVSPLIKPILIASQSTSEDEESPVVPSIKQAIDQSLLLKETSASSLDDESDQGTESSSSSKSICRINQSVCQASNQTNKRLRPSSRQHKLSSQYTAKAQRFSHPAIKQSNNQTIKVKSIDSISTVDENELIIPSNDLSLSQSVDQSSGLEEDVESIDESLDEQIDQSIDQPNNQSINQSIDHPTKLNPSAFSLLLAILRRSDGRDKLFRTIAFFISAVRSIIQSTSRSSREPSSRLVQRSIYQSIKQSINRSITSVDSALDVFSSAILSTRQLLRFGRWLTGYQSISQAWDEYQSINQTDDCESTSQSKLFALLDLLNSVFCCLIDCLDDVTYLSEIGVISESISEKTTDLSVKLSILAYCIDIPITMMALKEIREESNNQSNKQTVWSNPEFRSESLSLVRYCADLIYCLSDYDLSINQSIKLSISESVAQSCACLEGAISLYKLTQSQSLHRLIH